MFFGPPHVPDLRHFFRNGVACGVSSHREWGMASHVGHLGVDAASPHYGRLFVRTPGVALYRMPVELTNEVLLKRWWLGFEGSRPFNYEATLAELLAAADWLGG